MQAAVVYLPLMWDDKLDIPTTCGDGVERSVYRSYDEVCVLLAGDNKGFPTEFVQSVLDFHVG